MKKRIVVAPATPEPTPGKEPFYRAILTDHNGDFDMGAVLVGVVVLFMCLATGYDTYQYARQFDAQAFGIGVASVLVGFAGYKWGDAKRPETTTTTVTPK